MTKEDLDVILVGEKCMEFLHRIDCLELEHAYKIAEIIKKYKPEYVLYHEFVKGTITDPSDLCRHINELSLRNIAEKHGISLKDAGFTEETLNRKKLEEILLEAAREYDNKKEEYPICRIYLQNTLVDIKYLPNTYEEIIDRSLITYPPTILDYLMDILEKKRKEIEKEMNIANKNELNKILKNLENLYKALQAIRFKSMTYRMLFLNPIPRYYIIFSAICDVGAQTVGCGIYLKEKELWRIKDNDLNIYSKLYNEIREMAMANSIEKYVKKRKKDSPIIAIIGRAHLKNVAKLLEKKGIEYEIIDLPYEERELKERIYMKRSMYFDSLNR